MFYNLYMLEIRGEESKKNQVVHIALLCVFLKQMQLAFEKGIFTPLS